jgi:hypothetical protein
MTIKTPAILPGEPGYISRRERVATHKDKQKRKRQAFDTADKAIKNIRIGANAYRIGKISITAGKKKCLPIWRYSKKIGEILIFPDNTITLIFRRFGGIGNHKHLIQDADFQLQWKAREQKLLIGQNKCYICNKTISKSAKPNLYHYNLFRVRIKLLEEAEQIPSDVVSGHLTIEEGWEKFNDTMEEVNRYYMSLKDTALICANCAKRKNLNLL